MEYEVNTKPPAIVFVFWSFPVSSECFLGVVSVSVMNGLWFASQRGKKWKRDERKQEEGSCRGKEEVNKETFFQA